MQEKRGVITYWAPFVGDKNIWELEQLKLYSMVSALNATDHKIYMVSFMLCRFHFNVQKAKRKGKGAIM